MGLGGDVKAAFLSHVGPAKKPDYEKHPKPFITSHLPRDTQVWVGVAIRHPGNTELVSDLLEAMPCRAKDLRPNEYRAISFTFIALILQSCLRHD